MLRLLSLFCCLYFFVTAAGLCLVLTTIYPLVLIFDRQKKLLHYLTLAWGYHFVGLSPLWKCRIYGREHLHPGLGYVLVANHQSLADIFVLSGLRRHFRWVAKDELRRVPFFGWIMKLNGDVFIKRANIKSIKEMMRACRKWLKQGVSIMMFAEGTRSESGRLGDFHDGPFRLAVDCNAPIVPIVITGTRDVISKHSRVFNFRANMSITILPPVRPDNFNRHPGRLKAYVRELMKVTLEKTQADKLGVYPETSPDRAAKTEEAIDSCSIR